MLIYKYLHPDRIDILSKKMIRFSPPVAFNDPFEFKPVIDSTLSVDDIVYEFEKNGESLIEAELDKLPLELKKQLINLDLKPFFIQQVINNPSWINSISSQAANMFSSLLTHVANEQIGVLSLTEKKDNLLMWSHYADSHKGFCIGFDSRHDFFNRKRTVKDEFHHLRKVKYSKKRPNKALIKTNSTDFFLLKSSDWKYEQEWRICVPLKDADVTINDCTPNIHLYHLPPSCIKEIIIGVNSDSNLKEAIFDLKKTDHSLSHVDIYICSTSPTTFSLEFVKL